MDALQCLCCTRFQKGVALAVQGLAKLYRMLATSCRLTCQMQLTACAAHASRSASPGWWSMVANPCRMLATMRAVSSLALRAAPARAFFAMLCVPGISDRECKYSSVAAWS